MNKPTPQSLYFTYCEIVNYTWYDICFYINDMNYFNILIFFNEREER